MPALRARKPRRRGAVLVIVAVSLVMLMSVAALALDAGRLYEERRMAQAVADAAADAAGLQLFLKYSEYAGVDRDGSARASALAVAAANGYGKTGSRSTVTVNIPPASGPRAGRSGFAEVVITSRVPATFSSIFGEPEHGFQSRAVAAGTLVPTMASLLVLDPKKKNSLKLHSKSTHLEVAGDIFVNSRYKKAVKVDKRGQILAEHLIVVGGVDKKSKGLIDAEITTGATPTLDPLADVPTPPAGPKRDAKDFLTKAGKQEIYRLEPGTYKDLKFDKDDQVFLEPGIYTITGKFEVKDYAVLEGYDVMLYGAGKKGFKFKSRETVTLQPPSSGTYSGMTIFQNRVSKTKVEFKKAGTLNIGGIIYAPNSEVKFKDVDAEFDSSYKEDDKEEDDWEEDDEGDNPLDDGYVAESGVLQASIIAARVKIEKRARVILPQANIALRRPYRGLVE